jgi:hypothetical protein
MTGPQEWEQANSDYLATGLAWLRDLLEGADPASDRQPAAANLLWWTEDRFYQHPVPPALEVLKSRLGMSRFETLLLMMCVAMELDPDTEARCARAHQDSSLTAPTFSLALRLLPEPSWDALSAQSPLRYWRLVTVAPASGRPLTLSPLHADQRIVNYVKGLNRIDEWLVHLLRPVAELPVKELAPSQQDIVQRVIAVWDEPAGDGAPPLVELIGSDQRTCRSLAAAAASRAGLNLYEADPSQLPGSAGELAELLRRLDRESMLQPMACYLDLADLAPGGELAALRLATDSQATVIIGSAEPHPLSRRRTRLIDARRPSTSEQEQLWIDLLGPDQRVLAVRLADHYDLDPATIADCVEQAGNRAGTGPADTDSADAELIWTVCRDQIRPRLASLAHCVDPVAGWPDLVLPAEELLCLRQLADQVRGRPTVLREWGLQRDDSRGRGITALFCGQPGTGKTLAAEVIARELGLTLYRVDLSAVVSKYIGETERNLRQVFDAAEEGGALLFFDEADALFGKRSEVKDAHDRYANIEVNYLLQRMEDYRGIAILATNQRNAIDPAFLRRLRFVITFPFPSLVERRALWQRAFPPGTPTSELDLDRLAELPANGGVIRNISLNAAFCAAGQASPVTMSLVLGMARVEFRKLEMPLTDHHFQLSEEP